MKGVLRNCTQFIKAFFCAVLFFMEYILSLSYGKDSIATLFAIRELGYPLTRICHSEVMATKKLSANYPEVVSFKKYVDKYIFDNFGIKVEHFYPKRVNGVYDDVVSYEDVFYKEITRGKHSGSIYGFPLIKGSWCQKLKVNPFENFDFDFIQYLGIACDETERVKTHIQRKNVILPLVDIGWDEKFCYSLIESLGLLSPTYNHSFRDGCWFCNKQSIEQLRYLYNNYPDLWSLLLKWDNDSPVPFKVGLTVHDFDKRFRLENEHLISSVVPFRWRNLEHSYQYCFF